MSTFRRACNRPAGLWRFEGRDQVGERAAVDAPANLRHGNRETDRQVRFADARRAEEHDVFERPTKPSSCRLPICSRRSEGRRVKSKSPSCFTAGRWRERRRRSACAYPDGDKSDTTAAANTRARPAGRSTRPRKLEAREIHLRLPPRRRFEADHRLGHQRRLDPPAERRELHVAAAKPGSPVPSSSRMPRAQARGESRFDNRLERIQLRRHRWPRPIPHRSPSASMWFRSRHRRRAPPHGYCARHSAR